MKFNKISKRLAACSLAGVMMMSMMGMSVCAEGTAAGVVKWDENDTGNKNVAISKIITTDGNTFAPNTTFEFDVTPEDPDTWNGITTIKGVGGGLTGTTIKSEPGNVNDVKRDYTLTGNLEVHLDKFETPGVYHYTVSEKEPTEENKYEGIVYSKEQYDVYVYVQNKQSAESTQENDLYIAAVEVAKEGVKSNLSFTNDYGQTNDTTHDVKITKIVSGAFANMNDKFTFNVKVVGASNEKYKVVYSVDGINTTVISLTSGTPLEVEGIGNNGYIRIYGLTASDTYTVTEKEANQNGYSTTTSETGSAKTGTIPETQVTDDETTATITNSKEAVPATGVAMTVAPYILMVAVAGIFAILFLRRRHEEA